MTILQLISSEGYYGAESMLVGLSVALQQLGHKVIVGVFKGQSNPHIEVAQKAQNKGLSVELIECKGRFDWNAVRKIREILSTRSIDIVHAHGYKSDIYSYVAAPRKVALVSTCHNWPDPAPAMRVYAALDRIILRRFQQVTSPSISVMKVLTQSGICSSKLTYIANGIEISQFQNSEPSLTFQIPAEGKQVVGIVGRLVAEKGGETLLRAAQLVIKRFPNVLFVFIGEGAARKEWEAISNTLGISANVSFIGMRDDMPGVYSSINILALPSFNEAMPMCILEAMAAAIPVVASKIGSVPDLVLNNVTGNLVPPGDSEALADKLLMLLRNPDHAKNLGRAGLDHVLRNYSSEAMAHQYAVVYSKATIGVPYMATERKVEIN